MKGPGGDQGDFIESWMAIAHKARQRVCDSPEAEGADFDTLCYACEHESIRDSLTNLMTFPWISARVAEGSLTLAGMHFNVLSGTLETVV
jgi:carbonic anhydrase